MDQSRRRFMDGSFTKPKILPLEGKVSMLKKSYFFCLKEVWYTLYINEESFILYKDFEKKIIQMKIPLNSIIAVNKRQITRSDMLRFSVYYRINVSTNNVEEIKLKAAGRADMMKWISHLRMVINQNPFTFSIQQDEEYITSYLKGLYSIDSQKSYISINMVDYIIKKHLMEKFLNRIKPPQHNKKASSMISSSFITNLELLNQSNSEL